MIGLARWLLRGISSEAIEEYHCDRNVRLGVCRFLSIRRWRRRVSRFRVGASLDKRRRVPRRQTWIRTTMVQQVDLLGIQVSLLGDQARLSFGLRGLILVLCLAGRRSAPVYDRRRRKRRQGSSSSRDRHRVHGIICLERMAPWRASVRNLLNGRASLFLSSLPRLARRRHFNGAVLSFHFT